MGNPRVLKLDLFLLLHFANIVFAVFLLVTGIERGHWPYAVFGAVSLCGLRLRFGWLVPITVAGIYLGTFIFQPIVMTGSLESQIRKMVTRIVVFVFAGLIAGFLLDHSRTTCLDDHSAVRPPSDTD